MKVIESVYGGVKFRSRLEARWAVFFDTLGIDWIYEPEGFVFDGGLRYLPDFYLPEYDGGTYVEVKPVPLNELELKKAISLAENTNKYVVLAIGVPEMAEYPIIVKNDEYITDNCITGIFEYDQAENENRFFVCSGYTNADFNEIGMIPDDMLFDGKLQEAVNNAKSARFEFNNQKRWAK